MYPELSDEHILHFLLPSLLDRTPAEIRLELVPWRIGSNYRKRRKCRITVETPNDMLAVALRKV